VPPLVDETYVKVAGKWRHLYRAVGQYGHVIEPAHSRPSIYCGSAVIARTNGSLILS
jgi:hypothetical protein